MTQPTPPDEARAKLVLCECGTASVLTSGRDVYPHREDLYAKWFYVCPADGFKVGCHETTTRPLGTPASPATQAARRAAHAAFDELWKRKLEREGGSKSKARGAGYRWLAEQLGIDPKKCHIGEMDEATARRVVELCAPYLRRRP